MHMIAARRPQRHEGADLLTERWPCVGVGVAVEAELLQQLLQAPRDLAGAGGAGQPFDVGFHRTVHGAASAGTPRSEEHTSELQSLMRISYAVFCLKKKKNT